MKLSILTLDDRKSVALYGARFQIKFLFRDSKQFIGLTDCQSRAAAVLDFHFNAAFAMLNLARAGELWASPTSAAPVFSMSRWKQHHFNERLLEVLSARLALDLIGVKNPPCYEELRTYGAIAA